MRLRKGVISLLTVLTMLVSIMSVAAFAENAAPTSNGNATFTDMPSDWSATALKNAVANGLLNGSNGKIMPKDSLTRAQMAAIIVRAFGATVKGSLNGFSDVSSSDWFADSIAIAYNMGVIKGFAGEMNPNDPITRQEAFVILARALKLSPAQAVNTAFSDVNNISGWAKGEVFALINAGYVKGAGGKLNPQGLITRAEFAQVMDNIIKQYISVAGTYTSVSSGNVMVNVPGVTLKGLTVSGDLIVGDGVGDGELTLDSVNVSGRMVIRGGGVNSIIIKGSSSVSTVIITRVDGVVSVVSFAQGLSEFYKRHDGAKPPEYLRWGFCSLNKMLCAESGDFIIIGGYPSAGKTVLAIEFAWELAFHSKKRVGVFSLETKDEKLYDRLICRASDTPFDDIKHNTISNDSWKNIAELGGYADSIKLDVIKASGMTVNDIRAISLAHHYDVIFIDYLQLISSGGRYRGNRTEEVAGISMALHTFSQTSDVTIVALSQLSRQDKTEKSKAPTMASLRESGQLEQDADIVMLLYLVDEADPNGDRRLKIGKNKEGERGFITLGFNPTKMQFTQKSSRTDEPPNKTRSRFTEVPQSNYQDELPGFLKEGKS